jgi:hypothetical protein
MRRRAHQSVQEHTQTNSKKLAKEDENPLYGVAMLKIAMELKRANPQPLDDIVSAVLSRMQLPREPFDRYLKQNAGLLRTLATGGKK